MKKHAAAVLSGLLLIGASGAASAKGTCGSGGPTGAGVRVETDMAYYKIWAPTDSFSKPLPLVIGLHGDGGSPDNVTTYLGPYWTKEKSFILMAPKTPSLCTGDGSWRTCDTAKKLEYLKGLVAELGGKYNVDIDRVYITGWSGGSTFIGYRIWGAQSVFAAIQMNCGGTGPVYYVEPPRPECKIDGRFFNAENEKLIAGAGIVRAEMEKRGHAVQWDTIPPVGPGLEHCVGPPNRADYTSGMLSYFLGRTLCHTTTGDGCGWWDGLPKPGGGGDIDGGTGGGGGTDGGAGGSGGGGTGGAGGGTGGTGGTAGSGGAAGGGGSGGSGGAAGAGGTGGGAGKDGGTGGSGGSGGSGGTGGKGGTGGSGGAGGGAGGGGAGGSSDAGGGGGGQGGGAGQDDGGADAGNGGGRATGGCRTGGVPSDSMIPEVAGSLGLGLMLWRRRRRN